MKIASIILFATLIFGFAYSPKPSAEINWQTNFKEALKKAKQEKKKVLVNFTGSDWCGWCVKMDKDVFSQEDFVKYAEKSLICVKLDFPRRKKISEEEKQQNRALAEKYGVQGLPYYLLLDGDENVILQQSGYQSGGPSNYISQLETAIKENKEKN